MRIGRPALPKAVPRVLNERRYLREGNPCWKGHRVVPFQRSVVVQRELDPVASERFRKRGVVVSKLLVHVVWQTIGVHPAHGTAPSRSVARCREGLGDGVISPEGHEGCDP